MFSMQPGMTQGSAGNVPDVVNLPPEASQTFKKGTVLKVVAGAFNEVTVDTDNGSLHSVSLEGCTSGDPDGPADELAAARINDDTYFLCLVDDGAGNIITDLSGLAVGQQGDLNKQASGEYTFDSTSTANAALEIVKIFDNVNLVLVKFISTVVA